MVFGALRDQVGYYWFIIFVVRKLQRIVKGYYVTKSLTDHMLYFTQTSSFTVACLTGTDIRVLLVCLLRSDLSTVDSVEVLQPKNVDHFWKHVLTEAPNLEKRAWKFFMRSPMFPPVSRSQSSLGNSSDRQMHAVPQAKTGLKKGILASFVFARRLKVSVFCFACNMRCLFLSGTYFYAKSILNHLWCEKEEPLLSSGL